MTTDTVHIDTHLQRAITAERNLAHLRDRVLRLEQDFTDLLGPQLTASFPLQAFKQSLGGVVTGAQIDAPRPVPGVHRPPLRFLTDAGLDAVRAEQIRADTAHDDARLSPDLLLAVIDELEELQDAQHAAQQLVETDWRTQRDIALVSLRQLVSADNCGYLRETMRYQGLFDDGRATIKYLTGRGSDARVCAT